MKKNIEEIIEKYIYAVSKKLPHKQRDDIQTEIRTLIDDLIEDKYPNNEITQEEIEKLLKELGSPKELAANYKSSNQYLIGPDFFDNYMYILKIVLIAVAGGMSLAFVIKFVLDTPTNILLGIIEGFGSIFSALLGVFAWITIIFALINKYSDESFKKEVSGNLSDNDWSIKDLPLPPAKKAIISKAESIFGIIFHIIFFIIFNFAPQMIGIISVTNNTTRIVPFLNLDNISSFVLIVNIVIGLGLLKEIMHLLEGKYTLRLSIGSVILSSVSLILTIVAITNPAFWNQNFISQIDALFSIDALTIDDIRNAISLIYKLLIALVIAIFAIENGNNFYKAIKYGNKKD